jgi:hypothetical protein
MDGSATVRTGSRPVNELTTMGLQLVPRRIGAPSNSLRMERARTQTGRWSINWDGLWIPCESFEKWLLWAPAPVAAPVALNELGISSDMPFGTCGYLHILVHTPLVETAI